MVPQTLTNEEIAWATQVLGDPDFVRNATLDQQNYIKQKYYFGTLPGQPTVNDSAIQSLQSMYRIAANPGITPEQQFQKWLDTSGWRGVYDNTGYGDAGRYRIMSLYTNTVAAGQDPNTLTRDQVMTAVNADPTMSSGGGGLTGLVSSITDPVSNAITSDIPKFAGTVQQYGTPVFATALGVTGGLLAPELIPFMTEAIEGGGLAGLGAAGTAGMIGGGTAAAGSDIAAGKDLSLQDISTGAGGGFATAATINAIGQGINAYNTPTDPVSSSGITMSEAVSNGATVNDLTQLGFSPQDITNALATGNITPLGNTPQPMSATDYYNQQYQSYIDDGWNDTYAAELAQGDVQSGISNGIVNPVTNAYQQYGVTPQETQINPATGSPYEDIYGVPQSTVGTQTVSPETPQYVYGDDGITPVAQLNTATGQWEPLNAPASQVTPSTTTPTLTVPTTTVNTTQVTPTNVLTTGSQNIGVDTQLYNSQGMLIDANGNIIIDTGAQDSMSLSGGVDTGMVDDAGNPIIDYQKYNSEGMPVDASGNVVIDTGSTTGMTLSPSELANITDNPVPEGLYGSQAPDYSNLYNPTTGEVDWAKILVPSTISVGATLLASYLGSQAQKDAADTIAAAQREAAATQERMYHQTVERMKPYTESGARYAKTLEGLMPSLTQKYDMNAYLASPEYQNSLITGKRQAEALKAGTAAKGMYGSGNMASALIDRAQENAQLGYQTGFKNYWDQNQGIYNMYQPLVAAGQSAAANLGATGTQVANNIASGIQTAGTGVASTQTATGNIYGNAATNIGQNLAGAANAYFGQGQGNAASNAYNKGYNTGYYPYSG